MKTCNEARHLILKHHKPLRKEKRFLIAALGYIASRNCRASVALPVWDNSAMDGFVLCAADIADATILKPVVIPICGVARAGDAIQKLKPKTALRIMTGAVVPAGGDTILPVEDAQIENEHLVFTQPLQKGRHIRYRGEEICHGALLSIKNQVVTPGTLAFLASVGVSQVDVFAVPRVAVIITGSELLQPGKKLKSGQIYESNSAMLIAALAEMKIKPVLVKIVRDHVPTIRKVLQTALKRSDVVLLSGGVSVGDYDFSKSVLAELKVKTIFWKVAQKPGKPIYFGMRGNQSIFGLPGNPASAFVCFYEYVYPALKRLAGWENPFLPRRDYSALQEIRRDSSKTLFLKCDVKNDCVRILSHQGSHMVSSLHTANALAAIPPGMNSVGEGEKVSVDILSTGN